jgi:hypothetical protein
VVEFADPSPAGAGTGAPTSRVHVFVVDGTLRARESDAAKRALAQAVHSLPPDDLVGLVVFDGVVRVFDMGRQEVGSAQVRPGDPATRRPRRTECA